LNFKYNEKRIGTRIYADLADGTFRFIGNAPNKL